MVVVAIVAILVVGPKDLPGMLRAFGKTIGNLRRMAGDFQRQFDDALKEAELDDVKKLSKSTSFQPLEDAKKSMESFQKKMNEPVAVETDASDAAKGGEAASGTEAKPAAPLKTGATGKTAAKPESSTGKPASSGKIRANGTPSKTASARPAKSGPAKGKKPAAASKAKGKTRSSASSGAGA